MPLSGLDKYETLVRVPDFGGPVSQEDYTSYFQEHFASQIVLRRLSADFNNVLSSGKTTKHFPFHGLYLTPVMPFRSLIGLTLRSFELASVVRIVVIVTCASDTRRHQTACHATRPVA